MVEARAPLFCKDVERICDPAVFFLLMNFWPGDEVEKFLSP